MFFLASKKLITFVAECTAASNKLCTRWRPVGKPAGSTWDGWSNAPAVDQCIQHK
jgi:hypothetical protein